MFEFSEQKKIDLAGDIMRACMNHGLKRPGACWFVFSLGVNMLTQEGYEAEENPTYWLEEMIHAISRAIMECRESENVVED